MSKANEATSLMENGLLMINIMVMTRFSDGVKKVTMTVLVVLLQLGRKSVLE